MRLLQVGAGWAVVATVIALTRVGSLHHREVERSVDPSAVPPAGFFAVAILIGGVIDVAIWLAIASGCRRGKRGARSVATVLCVLSTLGLAYDIYRWAGGDFSIGTALTGVIAWAIGVGAVVALHPPESNEWFSAGLAGRREEILDIPRGAAVPAPGAEPWSDAVLKRRPRRR